MIERQVRVAEVIAIRRYFYLKTALRFIHTRQSRFRIRFPRVKHVHLVFTRAHFAQVLDTIVVLIAVDVVYLLLRPTTVTDCPNGMMQINKNKFLAYAAPHAQVASFITLLASYRSTVAAC